MPERGLEVEADGFHVRRVGPWLQLQLLRGQPVFQIPTDQDRAVLHLTTASHPGEFDRERVLGVLLGCEGSDERLAALAICPARCLITEPPGSVTLSLEQRALVPQILPGLGVSAAAPFEHCSPHRVPPVPGSDWGSCLSL